MKKSDKKMIDMGQSSKKPATKIEAAFPSKKLYKKKSSMKIPLSGNLSEVFGTKVKAFPINLLKKEEAAGFKGGVEEEAINEKMKVLELKKKAEESVTAAAGDNTEFIARKAAFSGPLPSGFRAEIRGFDTGADTEEVYMALKEHFKSCGKILHTSVCVCEGYAHIDFARLDSLYKALEVKNARVGDHLVTVKKAFSYPIRVEIRGFDTRAGFEEVEKALSEHFGKCGSIEKISVNDGCAYIDFASIDSLNKALELDNTRVGGRHVAVMQPRFDTIIRPSEFRAFVAWSDDRVIDLEPVFEKCGEISGIHYGLSNMIGICASMLHAKVPIRAMIEFTKFDSLMKALNLNNTKVGNQTITVRRLGAGGHLRPGASRELLKRRHELLQRRLGITGSASYRPGSKSNFDN